VTAGLPDTCLGLTLTTTPRQVYVSADQFEHAATLLCEGKILRMTSQWRGCVEVVGHELRHVVQGQFHN
jgi:hypothetical protein